MLPLPAASRPPVRRTRLPLIAFIAACVAFVFSGIALWRAIDVKNDSSNRKSGPTATTIPFVSVPAVYNQDGFTASDNLRKAGFEVEVQSKPSFSVGKGKVVSQSPTAGARAPRGSKVIIDLSTGPP